MLSLTHAARPTTRRIVLALLIAGFATATAAQQERPRQGNPPPEQRQTDQRGTPPGQSVLRLLPADSVTQHSIMLPGGKLDYTATAGTFSLYDQTGERSAAIFYTAFVAKG